MKNKQILAKLLQTNNPDFQLLKASEELSELQTVLLQYITKRGRKTSKQEVIDEIGDVKIRLKILEAIFGKEKVKKRVNFKLNKFKEYLKEGKFKGNI